MSKRVSVTFPDDLYEQIEVMSGEYERSFSKQAVWLMRQGIAARGLLTTLASMKGQDASTALAGIESMFPVFEEKP